MKVNFQFIKIIKFLQDATKSSTATRNKPNNINPKIQYVAFAPNIFRKK